MNIQNIIKKILIICMFLLVVIPLAVSLSADYSAYHVYEGIPDSIWNIPLLHVGNDQYDNEFITLIKFNQQYTTSTATLKINLYSRANNIDLNIDVVEITDWPDSASYKNQPTYGYKLTSFTITPSQSSYTIDIPLTDNIKGLALKAEGGLSGNEKIITIDSLEIEEVECKNQGGTCEFSCEANEDEYDYGCGWFRKCCIAKPSCSDGTFYGRCSATIPKYCDNGQLIDKCSECGCPFDQACLSDGSCEISGVCLVRGSADIPYLSDPDIGTGYAKQTIEGVKTINELKSACTDTIYNSLLIKYCNINSESVQYQVVIYKEDSSLSSCAASGCEPHDCSTKKMCSDETPYEFCSTTIPKYCEDGQLIDKCSDCGCPSGQICTSDGSCSSICSDGTFPEYCSGTKPKYCDNGQLTDNCSECGCPYGQACGSDGSCVCSDGTPLEECSATIPKYCDSGQLIDRCSECGCPSGEQCQTDGSCIPIENSKNMLRYNEKQVFLVSDKNWREVLPLVPVAVWTGDEECNKGYGTPDNVCVYPMLIYHEDPERIVPNPLVEGGGGSVPTISGAYQTFIAQDDFINKIEVEVVISMLGFEYGLEIRDNQNNLIAQSEFFTPTMDTERKHDFIFNTNVNKGETYKLIFLIPGGSGKFWGNLNNPYEDGKFYTGSSYWDAYYESIGKDIDIRMKIYSGKPSYFFDADSIIYFMQQYSPEKVTIIGDTLQELDNLLIAQPELGLGLDADQIERISINDYLSYWEEFGEVVYVEDNYELALLASAYASLINAPLIIQGTDSDLDDVFISKNTTCVGSVSRACNENYNLEELQQKYFDETGTHKMILVNSNDLNIKQNAELSLERSSGTVIELFSKTSLSAPILASAKHEIILSTALTGYQEIDDFFSSKMDELEILPTKDELERKIRAIYLSGGYPNENKILYPDYFLTVIAAPNAIPIREYLGTVGIGAQTALYRGLDLTEYAHFYEELDPKTGGCSSHGSYGGEYCKYKPIIAAGRIQGMTLSDVSSYIARVLSYDKFTRNNNMKFIASPVGPYNNPEQAEILAAQFSEIGYNAIAVTSDAEGDSFDPVEWSDQHIIHYEDHGYASWAGISSTSIPLLTNSIIVNDACLTCSTYDPWSFCNRAIRQGALAHFGPIAIAFSGNPIPISTLQSMFYYYNEITLGHAIQSAFFTEELARSDFDDAVHSMFTLIGDPTFKLKDPYMLNEKLQRDVMFGG